MHDDVCAGYPDREVPTDSAEVEPDSANSAWRQAHGAVTSWGGDLFSATPAPMFGAVLTMAVTSNPGAEASAAAAEASAAAALTAAESSMGAEASNMEEAAEAAPEASMAYSSSFTATLVMQPSVEEIHAGIMDVYDNMVAALAAVDDVPARVSCHLDAACILS